MTQRDVSLDVLMEIKVNEPIGQLRAVPVSLGHDEPRAIVALYGADKRSVDPGLAGFYFPQDTLKMAVLTEEGKVLWRRDLGRGVLPSSSFCPAYTMDLDGDSVDEIWFVNNLSEHHPFSLNDYRLERVDARSGETTGRWEWPTYDREQNLGKLFRFFIFGGMVRGEPVLVTAQGTYGNMYLQGWRPDMSCRWRAAIGKDDPGARGSHMVSVVDMDGDGIDEAIWGERRLELDGGTEISCADRDTWHGHSDIVQPFFDQASGRWFLFTCREQVMEQPPRVACYNDRMERMWSDVDQGHIHMGWVAHVGPNREFVANAVRQGGRIYRPEGYITTDHTEWNYRALTGEPVALPFAGRSAYPVDLSGDGYHEFVYTFQIGDDLEIGQVVDRRGRVLGSVGSEVAMTTKFLGRPGEQVLAFHPDGLIRAWGDRNAVDSPEALARYAHPFYKINQRTTANSNHNCIATAGI